MVAEKIKYIASSYSGFLTVLLFRIFFLAAIAYGVYHFPENTEVLGWILVFLLIIFLSLGSETIRIYADKIVVKNDSLINLIFRRKARVIRISEIARVSFPASIPVPVENNSLSRGAATPDRPLLLYMKNGGEEILDIQGERQKREVADTITTLMRS